MRIKIIEANRYIVYRLLFYTRRGGYKKGNFSERKSWIGKLRFHRGGTNGRNICNNRFSLLETFSSHRSPILNPYGRTYTD